MRFIKAFGFIPLAMATVLLFLLVSPAVAQADQEIVLCKIGSKDLCPANEYWHPRKEVEAYPETNITFLSALETTCDRGRLRGPFLNEMGQFLTWKIETAMLAECTGSCNRVTVEGLPVNTKVTVDANDNYLWLLPLTLRFENCPLDITCIYSADLVLEIADPNIGGIPLGVAENELMGWAGGDSTCPKAISMDANLAMWGRSLTVLFSLFELTTEQRELQPAEEEHYAELHEEEWHQEALELEEEAAAEAALCNEDPGAGSPAICPGGHLITHVHETTLAESKAKLLNSLLKLECDVLFLGEIVEAPKPLLIEGNYTYSNCGSCTVEEIGGPSTLEFARAAHETANVTSESETYFNCSGISCYYNSEELSFTAKGPLLSIEENGEISTSEAKLNKVKGLFCPKEAKLDMTTTPLSAVYIANW